MSVKTVKAAVKPKTMVAEKPKRLSKMGEFMRKYPNGIGVIVDIKAVMK
ncbi:MAG: hypothetical protein LBU62_07690 [Bacteroidales bacterium]|jgi:hypothetical protein|nr:hypothetical protein [Bacteroidales bacterium]